MIEIVLLGTAALVPIPERALTAAALTCGGHTILFDCGEGTQTAARRAEVSLMKADMIALTHYHGDHIFGLPGLLQTMNSQGRTQPLTITGPRGLEENMEPILKLAGWTAYPIRLAPIPSGGLRLDGPDMLFPAGAKLEAFETMHRVPSQGYAFTLSRAGVFMPGKARELGVPVRMWGLLQKGQAVESDGRTVLPDAVLGPARKGLKFVFSGDTAPCESLTEAARDADLMVCEATYGEDDQAETAVERGHMTFALAARTAAEAGVKRLWLAHFSQMIEDPRACLPNALAVFPGAECGEDGMSAVLRFGE